MLRRPWRRESERINSSLRALAKSRRRRRRRRLANRLGLRFVRGRRRARRSRYVRRDESGDPVVHERGHGRVARNARRYCRRNRHKIGVNTKGLTEITAKVIDSGTMKKLRAGVFRGFSVGGKVLARDSKNPKTITKIRLDEVSLVDRPSNSEATLELIKVVGPTPPARRRRSSSSMIVSRPSSTRHWAP